MWGSVTFAVQPLRWINVSFINDEKAQSIYIYKLYVYINMPTYLIVAQRGILPENLAKIIRSVTDIVTDIGSNRFGFFPIPQIPLEIALIFT